jgi:hypothetical protein
MEPGKPISGPVVSTIIPTYRRPQYLRRAVLSALRQTYPHVLVRVFDNGSGDETARVVDGLAREDQRVMYHCHPENVGPYRNFNFGIQSVDTPFFSLLSDDDVLAPRFYEEGLKAFEQFPDAMFACLPAMVVDEDCRVRSGPIEVARLVRHAPGNGFRGPKKAPIPAAWTGILFRTAVREEIGLINEKAGPFADGGYVMHAAARFPFVEAPGLGGVLMRHQESTSGMIGPVSEQWLEWWDEMVRDVERDERVPEFVREEVRNVFAPDVRKTGFYQVLHALSRGNAQYAREAAAGVGGCGYSAASATLRCLVWCHARIPPFRFLLSAIRDLRQRRIAKFQRGLDERYGHLVEFMRLLNAESMEAAPIGDVSRTQTAT